MGIETLKNNPIFSELIEDEFNQLKLIFNEKKVDTGHFLMKENEPASSFYFLESGSVDILTKIEDSDVPRSTPVLVGTFFGELAFVDSSVQNLDVIARDQVQVYEIKYESLIRLVQKSPLMGIKFYRILMRSLAQKMQDVPVDFLSFLFQSRMAALGEMAGGVAHEINSPLTVIQLHAETIEEELKNGSKNLQVILKSSTKILSMVDRISKLIRSVKALSRNSENEEMVEVKISEVVDEVLEICHARSKDKLVQFKSDLPMAGVHFRHCLEPC